MKVKAVIFDLDGTLLDTLRDIADSANEALRQLGFPEHHVEEYKQLVGEGIETLAFKALPEGHRDSATVARLVAIYTREYDERWPLHTRPYEGIPEMLDELSRRKIHLAVLSNKQQAFTQASVARLLSAWQFDVVMGAQPSLPLKPDPTAALLIAQKLSLLPSDFLYLGDSGIDMKTAVNAGMYPVGALWGFRSAEELIASGARKTINHPCELIDLL